MENRQLEIYKKHNKLLIDFSSGYQGDYLHKLEMAETLK